MNYLLIIVLVLLAINVFDGFRKGFMKTMFALVSWVLVLIICNEASPKVADFIIEVTTVDETITSVIAAKINDMIATSDLAAIEQSVPQELRDVLFGEGGSLQDSFVANTEELISASSIVYTIVNVIAFIIVAVVSKVLMLMVDGILGIASKLPIIGSFDKLLGIVCGGARGLLICWVLLAIVGVFSLTGANTEWAAYITQSEFLIWMQENNFIFNMLVLG